MDDQINLFMLSYVENYYRDDDYKEILNIFSDILYKPISEKKPEDTEGTKGPEQKRDPDSEDTEASSDFYSKLNDIYSNLKKPKYKFFFSILN